MCCSFAENPREPSAVTGPRYLPHYFPEVTRVQGYWSPPLPTGQKPSRPSTAAEAQPTWDSSVSRSAFPTDVLSGPASAPEGFRPTSAPGSANDRLFLSQLSRPALCLFLFSRLLSSWTIPVDLFTKLWSQPTNPLTLLRTSLLLPPQRTTFILCLHQISRGHLAFSSLLLPASTGATPSVGLDHVCPSVPTPGRPLEWTSPLRAATSRRLPDQGPVQRNIECD